MFGWVATSVCVVVVVVVVGVGGCRSLYDICFRSSAGTRVNTPLSPDNMEPFWEPTGHGAPHAVKYERFVGMWAQWGGFLELYY